MKATNPEIDPSLYQNRKDLDHEIVYEVTTQKNRLPFGIAIADISQSDRHLHNETIETYTCVQGSLEVLLGEEAHILNPGDVLRIPIKTPHSARTLGKEPARITVTTIPEFSPDDYILVE